MAANLRLLYRSCSVILGNLSNNDSDGQENVVKRHLKTDVALLQNFIALTHSTVQFVKNELLLFSRRSRSRAVTAKKCTKKRVMQSCFASSNLLLFDVLVAVAVVVTQVT